jgi:hypothetical protein
LNTRTKSDSGCAFGGYLIGIVLCFHPGAAMWFQLREECEYGRADFAIKALLSERRTPFPIRDLRRN